MNKKLLILILLITSFLRLWKLGQVPVSLFSDELDVGYQAYSIIKTGKDYSGNAIPLHFESQAEFRTPLYIYSSIPTVALFGITPYGVRLPAAIFGILGVFVIYLLSNELVRGTISRFRVKFGIIPALLLSISPWHIQYSRAAFEVTMVLLFLMLGVYYFVRFTNKDSELWVPVLLFSVAPWIYSTAKLFIPIFFIALILIWKDKFKTLNKAQITKSAFILLIFAVPMLIISLKGQAGNRFSYISVFTDPTIKSELSYQQLQDSKVRQEYGGGYVSKITTRLVHNPITYSTSEVVDNYIRSFSADFLFIDGDLNLRHSVNGVGQFYRIDFLLLVFGVIVFFSDHKKRNNKLLILSWLILAVIPAAITRDGGSHATRLILLLPPLIILMSYGMHFFVNDIKKPLSTVLVLGYFGLLLINFMTYQHDYWYHNPWHSERSWHAGYKELIEGVKAVEENYDKIIITNAVEPPWIYFVSYYPYPPENNPRDVEKEEVYGFGELKKLDKYYFGQIGKIGVGNLARVLDNVTLYVAAEREVGENLIMNPDKTPKGLTLLKNISYPSGEPAFYFLEKDESVEVKPLDLIN